MKKPVGAGVFPDVAAHAEESNKPRPARAGGALLAQLAAQTGALLGLFFGVDARISQKELAAEAGLSSRASSVGKRENSRRFWASLPSARTSMSPVEPTSAKRRLPAFWV